MFSRKKECVAMLLAGGQGSRLYALTQKVAKPAVPFGAKWTITALISYPHSPFTHSGGTPQKTGVPPLLYIAANRFCP